MPSGYINIDAHFPSFNGKEDARQQTEMMLNYLRLLTEHLKYTFKNIGAENFNETELKQIKADTTAELEKRHEALTKRVNTLAGALQDVSEALGALTELVTLTIQPELDTLREAVQVDEEGNIVIGGEEKSVELTGTVTANGKKIQTN